MVAVIGPARSAETLQAVMMTIHLVPFPRKIKYDQRPRLKVSVPFSSMRDAQDSHNKVRVPPG
jgi:hypothetical protein